MNPRIVSLVEIKNVLNRFDPIPCIEEGFVIYSQGKVEVPPVGEMVFKDPPGDVHIKYGYIHDNDYYIIKIASGFYENVKLGLSSSNGLILVFKQKTGELAAILLDEAHLTNVRTAAAGAVAAKYLAPRNVQRIGIFGAGIQGRMQLTYLESITDCKDVIVWGIHQKELDAYREEMVSLGYRVQITMKSLEIASTCNLIITATPSETPLLSVDQIQRGTHITAMGSDTACKNELDTRILQKADIVVADSLDQSLFRGEIYKAVQAGVLKRDAIRELGNVIQEKELQRKSEEQITVADLTGVAVQYIQISKAVVKALNI
jgi:ornithine cyclodeaminase